MLRGIICCLLLSWMLSGPYVNAQSNSYPLQFEEANDTTNGNHKPNFLPPPLRLSLAPAVGKADAGIDALGANLNIGPLRNKVTPIQLAVFRSKEEAPYDGILLDKLGVLDERNIKSGSVEVSKSGASYISVFEDTATIRFDIKKPNRFVLYPVRLWTIVNHEKETPSIIYFTNTGYVAAPVIIFGRAYTVVMTDDNNNGIYDADDRWTIRERMAGNAYNRKDSKLLSETVTIRDSSFSLKLHDNLGLYGHLLAKKAGEEREKEKYRLPDNWDAGDMDLPSAVTPVLFYNNSTQALEVARLAEKYVFVAVEKPDCRDCKLMRNHIYPSRKIEQELKDFIAVTVNGNDKRFKVTTYPAGLILNKDGKEIARFEGFKNSGELQSFLQQVHQQ